MIFLIYLSLRLVYYIVVLFPAPLWPNKAVICPSKKFSVRLFTTAFSLNFFVNPRMDIPTGNWTGSGSMNRSLAIISNNFS